jgi:hypothetical protein
MTRSDEQTRREIARAVWFLNHRDGDDWLDWLHVCGYEVDRETRARCDELRLSKDGGVVAVIHDFPDEAFGYVFARERGADRWREVLWRLTHPFTRRTDPPWRTNRGLSRA